MHKFFAAFALSTMAAGAAVTPSLAASAPAGNDAPFCNASDGSSLKQERSELAQELQLRTKQAPTIDDWANCFKVSYVDGNGHQVVALYDPDSLKLIENLS